MTSRSTQRTLGLALLLGVGLLHITGTWLTPMFPRLGRGLAGLGSLTLASPHPKVFCQAGDHEPYGFAFTIDAIYDDGHRSTIAVDAQRYGRLQGPYMYRNVYGAVLAFSPFLEPPLIDQVLTYGLCESGDLLPLLDEREGHTVVRATVNTQARRPGPVVPPLEVTCP
ncbi:MAG: hypothetical protein AAFS10_21195 [Myxococcota bacterium]